MSPLITLGVHMYEFENKLYNLIHREGLLGRGWGGGGGGVYDAIHYSLITETSYT